MFYCWDHHNAILSPVWPCLSQFSFLLYSHKKMGEGSLCFSVHMPLIAGAKFNITRTSTIIAQGILHLCVTWWSHFHPSCFFLLKSNWAKSRARWKHEGRTEEQNKAFFLYLFFFFYIISDDWVRPTRSPYFTGRYVLAHTLPSVLWAHLKWWADLTGPRGEGAAHIYNKKE